MIFKRVKQLEWRVAELELDKRLLLERIEDLNRQKLSTEDRLEKIIKKEDAANKPKRGRGRPRKTNK